uniref:Uncharacterized protein n=1 Tax=Nelumbo nucifera TaxID=4432 RepID=A0A822YK77_NELNU|nr:TPA_asm: hypothetical protein HUJ06_010792 [Nelumbo nucifera]
MIGFHRPDVLKSGDKASSPFLGEAQLLIPICLNLNYHWVVKELRVDEERK